MIDFSRIRGFVVVLFVLAGAAVASAQLPPILGQGSPIGVYPCNSSNVGQDYKDVTAAQASFCDGQNWRLAAGAGVSSFNARTGAIAPASGDYSVDEITSAASAVAQEIVADDPKYATGCTVVGTTYTNPASCAYFTAKSLCVTGTSAATSSCPTLTLGVGHYNVEVPLTQLACSFSGQPGVNIRGLGHGQTWLVGSTDNHASGLALIQGTDSTAGSAYCTSSITGVTIEPNLDFVRALDLIAQTRPILWDVTLKSDVFGSTNTSTQQTDVMQVGNLDVLSTQPVGGVIEPVFNNVSVDSYSPAGIAQFTTVVTGGVPVVTITTAGTGYDQRAIVRATGWEEIVTATGKPGPCTVMGTMTWTLSGSGFATITPTGFSGCEADMQFVASNSSAVGYGIDFLNVTDVRQMNGVTSTAGNLAQFHLGSKAGNNVFEKLHPFGGFLPVGVLVEDAGHVNVLTDPECDSVVGACIVANAQAAGSALKINNTRSFWNNSLDSGAGELYVENTANYSSLIFDGNSCGNTQTYANGYHHIIMPNGPLSFNSGETGSGTLTANVLLANHTPCDGNNILFPVTSLNFYVGGQGLGTQYLVGFTGTTGPRGYIAIDNTGTQPMIFGTNSGHSLMFKAGVPPFTNTFVGGFDTSGNFGVCNSATPGTCAFHVSSSGAATASLFQAAAGTAIASAATIAPIAGVTHITGTAAIATITPPAGMSSTIGGCITLIADAVWTTVTTGNISDAITSVAATPYNACYDGSKWFIK